MKEKTLLITIFTLNSILGFSQINKYDKQSYATYQPLSPSEILAPAMMMKERYDNNASKVDALIESIFELRKQTDDEVFLKTLDKQYQKLKGFYNMNLAAMDNQIREVHFAILEEVDKYNRKIKSQSNTPKKKDTSNLRGYQKVYDYSPILEKPEMSSNQVGKSVNNIVEIIAPHNNNFYLVRSGNIEGYIWIGWFK